MTSEKPRQPAVLIAGGSHTLEELRTKSAHGRPPSTDWLEWLRGVDEFESDETYIKTLTDFTPVSLDDEQADE